jgi:hypothetical protein
MATEELESMSAKPLDNANATICVYHFGILLVLAVEKFESSDWRRDVPVVDCSLPSRCDTMRRKLDCLNENASLGVPCYNARSGGNDSKG